MIEITQMRTAKDSTEFRQQIERYGVAVADRLGRAEVLMLERAHCPPPPTRCSASTFESAFYNRAMTEGEAKDYEQWKLWYDDRESQFLELLALTGWFRADPRAREHRAVLSQLEAWGREFFRECFRHEGRAYWPMRYRVTGEPCSMIDALQRWFPRVREPEPSRLFLTE